MPKIFISYRQQDSLHIAARINESLVNRYGEDSTFFDVESLQAGVDVPSHIKKNIQKTNVLIVVIGPELISMEFKDGPKAGTRKIDDPEDYPRIELEMAISNKVPIVPVLVSGAKMPEKSDLPPSLSSLISLKATKIYDEYFKHSLERLFRGLDDILKVPYDAKEKTINELKQKINFDGEFNSDACKLAVRILNRSVSPEDEVFLKQIKLFVSGKISESSFLISLEEENRRQESAEVFRQKDLEIKELKIQAELERRTRKQSGIKLQEDIKQLKKFAEENEPWFARALNIFKAPKLKSAKDFQTKLKMPLFLSIPDWSSPKVVAAAKLKMLKSGSTEIQQIHDARVIGGDVNQLFDSYYAALRDRLVLYFESINLTRKPKLVAVTSVGKGAGVSTIAAGLAASLSETGDGRILLVDMNHENGATQQFFNGKPNCLLDDALITKKRDTAKVQDNLYFVSEGSNVSDKLTRVLPKRFATLVPQLKASDYDYIIFDMPPVSQTSVTTRLAGFMDTVMLVIESGKTDREVVQQASALLAQSKANVTAVLNKARDLPLI